jgi:hypothetical protein
MRNGRILTYPRIPSLLECDRTRDGHSAYKFRYLEDSDYGMYMVSGFALPEVQDPSSADPLN